METTLQQRNLLVLAEGSSAGEVNNRRGHLFEEFVAQLLGVLGYEHPTRESLNNTAEGIEIDVRATHMLTKQPAMAECKAYTANLPVKDLLAFYGKVQSERIDAPDLFGVFVAIPGLTADARERRDKIQAAGSFFRALTLEDIFSLLLDRQEIVPLAQLATSYARRGTLTDEALLVTEKGLYFAAKELDDQTKLATRVLVFPARGSGVAPPNVAELLANSTYASGLPCQPADLGSTPSAPRSINAITEPTVTEVAGSSADFEYQLPASPQFFVGRGRRLSELERHVRAVQEEGARAQVVVFNAQSGWGKSSLALKVASTVGELGGVAVCIDCRTAVHPIFVTASIRKALNAGERGGILRAGEDASFASVAACVETLRRTAFLQPLRPLLVFFDQFENVFRNPALTREFRDLAFGVSDLQAPVVLGFAWKTDLLAFTEGHPYQYRDDIRARAKVFDLELFGSEGIGALLTRLQRTCDQRIHRDLRDRIREYSQGLPWLFKKLANHIQRELVRGVTQDKLISEVLNVQSLFESDLRGLTPQERQALTAIARNAPILASEAVDLSGGAEVVQTLVNQRLLVQVGERLDVYWDIFRDYLTSGSVPLQDSYILRLTPNGVSKFLQALTRAGGEDTVEGMSRALSTSRTAVHNSARDLRLLGVLAVAEGPLRFNEGILTSGKPNVAMKARVAVALRRHRAFDLVTRLAASAGSVEMGHFASVLPEQYPGVDANEKTWGNYARAFAYWFQYAGLAVLDGDRLTPNVEEQVAIDLFTARKGANRSKSAVVFPRSAAGPVIGLIDGVARGALPAYRARHEGDAILLGLVRRQPDGLHLTEAGQAYASASGEDSRQVLLSVLEQQPSFLLAADMVRKDPAVKSLTIGKAIADRYSLAWKDGTAAGAGKYLRSWCRAVGLETRAR